MPQASVELQDLMHKWFGDAVSEVGPTNLLLSRGYRLDDHFFWHKPTPSHEVSDIEWSCLCFLIDEWDFDIKW